MIYLELFYTFFLIGLFTFGGGYAMIPLIQEQVVAKGWLSSNQITDFIAISEVTPGPFAINISTFIGSQIGGVFGAFLCTLAVVLPSFLSVLIIAVILKRFLKNRFVNGAFCGLRPTIVSLLLSTTIVLFVKVLFFSGGDLYSKEASFDRTSFAILAILSLLMIVYKKSLKRNLNPLFILLISGLLGLFVF